MRRPALPPGVARALAALAAGAVLACPPASARAQPDTARADAPLDRVIDVRLVDVPLRVALAEVAARARVPLAYGDDFVPLDRPVTIARRGVRLRAALAELLAGTGTVAVAGPSGQVVLVRAPGGASAPSPSAPPGAAPARRAAREPALLEEVVVTGTADGGAVKSLPVAITVVRDPRAVANGGTRLGDVLAAGAVPGVLAWAMGPSAVGTAFASLRGASSLGASYPKVFLDGVELASPLQVGWLDLRDIERVEIIRGPQGAGLYGADAISGVIQLVSRRAPVLDRAVRWRVESSAGAGATRFAPAPAWGYDAAASADVARGALSLAAGASAVRFPEYAPGGHGSRVTGHAALRALVGGALVDVTARHAVVHGGAPVDPAAVAGLPAPGVVVPPARHAAEETTVGVQLRHSIGAAWTGALAAGVDRSWFGANSAIGRVFPAAVDSALLDQRGTLVRWSARWGGTWRGALGPAARLTLTAGADAARTTYDPDPLPFPRQPPPGLVPDSVPGPEVNVGALVQGVLGVRDALFVTGGARVERNNRVGDRYGTTTLPAVGAAWVRRLRAGGGAPAALKLRASYGRGLRPPPHGLSPSRYSAIVRIPNPFLSPESQSGVEWGAELATARGVLQATRFRQRAEGLVQLVFVSLPPMRSAAQLQNVGAIRNDGWELEGTVRGPAGSWARGAYSWVDARVLRTSPYYTGELRAGDRLLEVPRWFGSVSAGAPLAGVELSATATLVGPWVNYDRAALVRAAFGGQPIRLREYWIEYAPTSRVGVSARRPLGRGASVALHVDNLLHRQTGERDNLSVVPGRTATLRMAWAP